MKIKDLIDLVEFNIFYDTCRTKLNNTLVQYKGEWGYCLIADGPIHGDEGTSYKYGSGKSWITLRGLPSFKGKDKVLNTLDDIETELEWPDMGYYYWKDHSYQLTYPTTNVYKAGLAPQQILLRSLHPSYQNVQGAELTKFLNSSVIKKQHFPSLGAAVKLLKKTENRQIPISRHALLEAHPYSELPVVSYGSIPIGVADDGVLILSPSNKPLGEYFKHVGVPFKHELSA